MRNIHVKKSLLGFKPELHWELIIGGMAVSIVCVIAYSVYIYSYATQQIDMEVVAPITATSTPQVAKLFTSSEQMQELFEIYKSRQSAYNTVLRELLVSQKKVVATTSSTSIATSSKQ